MFVQVSYYLDKTNIERETRALVDASIEKDNSDTKNQLIIITESLKDSIVVDGKKIEIVPLYEWLLNN